MGYYKPNLGAIKTVFGHPKRFHIWIKFTWGLGIEDWIGDWGLKVFVNNKDQVLDTRFRFEVLLMSGKTHPKYHYYHV